MLTLLRTMERLEDSTDKSVMPDVCRYTIMPLVLAERKKALILASFDRIIIRRYSTQNAVCEHNSL